MKYLSETSKNIKLKSCPFCEHNAEITERYHTDEGYIINVGCSNCFCKITKNLWFDFNKSHIKNTITKMIEKWNMRSNDIDTKEDYHD